MAGIEPAWGEATCEPRGRTGRITLLCFVFYVLHKCYKMPVQERTPWRWEMQKGVPNVDLRQDLRDLPAYGMTETSHYLQIPLATLRSWTLGRHYPTQAERRFFKPIIVLPEEGHPLLSFMNLVEAYILDAIRRKYGVQLRKVRMALNYLRSQFPSKHPLADHHFQTDGLDLFTKKYGQLINVSQAGQLAMREIVEAYLRRIERDEQGVPIKLYPFTRKRELEEPKVVVIDPYVSFGRPILVGTGIPTVIIAERYKAGESIDDLAEDYRRQRCEIEEAIRCELQPQAA